MPSTRQALAESVAVAVGGFTLAASFEALIIRTVRPTEWELAWIGDLALAIALGVAVYLWRGLLATRRALAERERAEIVMETELAIAADIQRRLLPTLPPATDGYEWAAALRPAGRIGGDFYDFVETAPGVWVTLVADVSGKGIPAALALGSLRSTFRALAGREKLPSRIVTHLSAGFYQDWHGLPYLTCIVAVFDLQAGTVLYCNAGHPAGIVTGPAGTRYLDRGGPGAGLFPQWAFEHARVDLHPGDMCLLVSDGVTESLDGTPLERRLLRWRGPGVSAADVCKAVMEEAIAGAGPNGDATWDDDRTVVVITAGIAGTDQEMAESLCRHRGAAARRDEATAR